MRLDAPVAELARRLGSEATRLGLHRPSYACDGSTSLRSEFVVPSGTPRSRSPRC
jgi:hypothetical protein